MFSVSPAEILTIAVVALLVFGPKRLPEIARKAGKLVRDLRSAANELTSGLEDEYQEVLEPFKDVRDTMKDAIAGVEREARGTAAAPPKPPSIPPEPAAAHQPTGSEGPDEQTGTDRAATEPESEDGVA